MTIKDFLMNDAIIESENNCYIDSEFTDEEDREDWLKNYLYPLINDEDVVLWIINYPYESLEALKESLLEDDAELAKQIILSALKFRRALPNEEIYYINDSGNFHIEVQL